mgnify:CR=1 FL=1
MTALYVTDREWFFYLRMLILCMFDDYCPVPLYIEYHVHLWFACITLFYNLETTFIK